MSKLAKIITWIIIILALVGAIGAIAYFTGGFNTEFTSFYLTVDGKDVLDSASGYVISMDEPTEVEVKYTFEDAEAAKGYSVKVVPNPIAGKDFDFLLDEDVYSFQAEKDLTAGFDIEYGDTSFTIKAKGGVEQILQAVYPNNTIGECSRNAYTNMFLLVVDSYNGESTVTIAFTVDEGVIGVEITPDKIIF